MQNPYKLHGEEILYQSKKLTFLKADLEINGHRHTQTYFKTRDTVSILAINQEDKIAIVQQWRYPVNQATLEIPAGHIENQAAPLQEAQRELQEETGHTAQNWQKLGEFYYNASSSTKKTHIFLATNLTKTQTNLDPDEDITLHWHTLQELQNMIKTHKINHPATIIALHHYTNSHNQPSTPHSLS